jgi:divalent metal cation (Fe/Co/Zn/Cd) transporter
VHKTRGQRDPALAFPLANTRDDADERRQANRAIAVSAVGAGIAGAVLGIIGNLAVARYKMVVGRRINSATLIADARHSSLDALSSAGALAGLIAVALWSVLG